MHERTLLWSTVLRTTFRLTASEDGEKRESIRQAVLQKKICV
jgi:hypothetical protein